MELSRAMTIVLNEIDAQLEFEANVRTMTNELMIKIPGLVHEQAKLVARAIVRDGSIIWR